MRIAVDARPIYQEPTLRGVGKTLLYLYLALAKRRPDWQFDMHYQISNGLHPPLDMTNIIPRAIDGPGDRLTAWQNFWFPVTSWRKQSALMHCHGAIAPRYPIVPLVVTIHDLTPLEFRPRDPDVQAWGRNVHRAARTAHTVLTPSEYVAGELMRVLGVASNKITVIPWGPNEAVRRVEDEAILASTAKRYGLTPGQPFLLHFGMALARKNTRRVIEAWAGLPESIRTEARLVIVGLEGPALTQFQTMAREHAIEGSCRLHGYIPECDIPALISAAKGVCYVPFSEGFGLPILDAFACHTPVLAARTTSLPEVAGDAALYVDPASTEEVRQGMHDLLTDPALRADLACRGVRQLARFSWDGCAQQVAQVFEQVRG